MKYFSNYINFIQTFLLNKNIDNDDTEWQSSKDLSDLATSTATYCITNSIKLKIDCKELILVVKVNHDSIDDTTIDEIKDGISNEFDELKESEIQSNQINILFFVSSIDTRIKLKEAFARKNVIEILNSAKKTLKLNRPKITPAFYLNKNIENEELKIPNIKRYEMITLPPMDIDIDIPKKTEEVMLKGTIFTANLFDIVKLYNAVGDQLFKKNVRMGINDQLDVDKSIKETLKDSPEAFWFRNNGITILMEGSDIILDRVNEIVLKEANCGELSFSVINGAQTITAAAEYYYSQENEASKSTFNKAKVMIKIIYINAGSGKESKAKAESEARSISVALNRQKPIKSEDIAFSNDFIHTMNEYLESNETYKLVRRGEESSVSGKNYSLISFVKARKACSGNPGSARSSATSTLLSVGTNNIYFTDTDIFIRDWYNITKEEQKDKIFKKYYSPVLFAMDLAAKTQAVTKNTGLSIPVGNVIKNGLWYFVAYTVYLLNDCRDDDYSNFQYTADKLTAEDIKQLFEKFAEFYCKKLNATEQNTSSNEFKKSDNYNILKKADSKSEYRKLLFTLMEKKNNSRTYSITAKSKL